MDPGAVHGGSNDAHVKSDVYWYYLCRYAFLVTIEILCAFIQRLQLRVCRFFSRVHQDIGGKPNRCRWKRNGPDWRSDGRKYP